MTITTLAISGMTCNHCVRAVQAALAAVPGVRSAQVMLEKNEARVDGDADPVQLELAVKSEGYEAHAVLG
jgi:copper chaperone